MPDEYKHFPALQQNIVHSTLLEELIFWTFEYEFPQNFVCFLLNMLPDPEYKVGITCGRETMSSFCVYQLGCGSITDASSEIKYNYAQKDSHCVLRFL